MIHEGREISDLIETSGADPVESNKSDVTPDEQFRLAMTFAELGATRETKRERILFGLSRSEVGLLNSINNVGKTTLLRNLMISMCIGQEFPPLATEAVIRRVVFIDFEDSRASLRADFASMLASLSESDQLLFAENALFICEVRANDGEDLSLSNAGHLQQLIAELATFRPDVIIVDTIGSAFDLTNENDNAEVRRAVMKPLKRLAVDAALIATHHIGKSKLEDGRASEASFRGRGASSFADMARLVLNLERGTNGQVVLRCAKSKTQSAFMDAGFRLNADTRWFEPGEQPVDSSTYSVVVGLFDDGHEHELNDVQRLLEGRCSKRAVYGHLQAAIQNKDLCRPRRGVYKKPIRKVQS